MSRPLVTATVIFLSLLFIPQSLLGFRGFYLPKLRVVAEPTSDYFVGVFFALLFLCLFFVCAALAGFARSTLKDHALELEYRRSFRTIMLLLTLVIFIFLAMGIGTKQSGNALNFLIRLLPRELLLIISTVMALATFNRFWIALMILNILYWMGIGSKASLFLVALAMLYYFTLERVKFKPTHIIITVILLLLLPISYLVPVANKLEISIFQLLGSISQSPELTSLFAGKILGRISWFDGMLLNAQDLVPLAHYGILDFIDVALAGFVPGLTANEKPFGIQVIYLFNATHLENFAGAIGIPGMFKAMAYNHGIGAVLSMLLLIGSVLTVTMRLSASRQPVLSLLGFSTLVILMFTLFISGNVDSALGKISPLIFSGLFYFNWARALLSSKNYDTP